MALKISAGLLMYKLGEGGLEVLLAHPGGPLYQDKDIGYWGIPKGEVEDGESVIEAACREFREETGLASAVNDLVALGSVAEASGKTIYAWAFPGDCDTASPIQSNLFAMEWPQGSGLIRFFPEVDRLKFFSLPQAWLYIEQPQHAFLQRVEQIMRSRCRTA